MAQLASPPTSARVDFAWLEVLGPAVPARWSPAMESGAARGQPCIQSDGSSSPPGSLGVAFSRDRWIKHQHPTLPRAEGHLGIQSQSVWVCSNQDVQDWGFSTPVTCKQNCFAQIFTVAAPGEGEGPVQVLVTTAGPGVPVAVTLAKLLWV